MAYNNVPTKEERKRLRGEGDKIRFIDFGFEIKQVIGFWKGRGTEDVC